MGSQWGHAVGKPVMVEWRDAYFDFSRDGEGLSDRDDYRVTTYGELLSDGPLFFDVAAELLPDGDQRAVTHIPVELVLSCHVMEPVKTAPGVTIGG
jgi:hypothetical protein